MQINQMLCDGCEKPMDPKMPRVEFKPIRGGLALNIVGTDKLTVKQINRTTHFHNWTCVEQFANTPEKVAAPEPTKTPDKKTTEAAKA